jgi:hypothetical protein
LIAFVSDTYAEVYEVKDSVYAREVIRENLTRRLINKSEENFHGAFFVLPMTTGDGDSEWKGYVDRIIKKVSQAKDSIKKDITSVIMEQGKAQKEGMDGVKEDFKEEIKGVKGEMTMLKDKIDL